ncbi:thermonuclease family protein [Shewanella surugensis]|uniref:Thermonuclease family protein n=1 Tax=Shewanella surugensis TaxID=212020 RepID=A0ABT0LIP6_9GAMM|nr:thermonuclease family protein [Shewanella surugensis]MCL1127559.1 thermonuclease family protein [Shewanella surugensis]
MLKALSIFILLFFYIPMATANPQLTTESQTAKITAIYSADHFSAYLPEQKESTQIRLNGVYTPSLDGQCAKETELALKAKAFVTEYIKNAKKILLTEQTHDENKILWATMYVDGNNLSYVLINKNLGRKWPAPKESWCH